MTISPYLETASYAVNEPVQNYEPDDNDATGSFAAILAGLLQRNEPEIQIDSKQDSEIKPLESNAENSEFNELNVEKAANSPVSAEEVRNSGEEPPEVDLSEDQISFLISAQQLQFSLDVLESVEIQPENDFIQELINSEFPARLVELDNEALPLAEIDAFEESASLVQAFIDDLVPQFEQELASKNAQSLNFNAQSNNVEKIAIAPAVQEIAPLIPDNKQAERSNQNEVLDKLDESRAKRKDKITFEVRDYRTTQQGEKVRQVQTGAVADKDQQSNAGRELTLELRLPNQENSQEQVFEVKAGRAFEDLLSRELHQNFNGDIVRHASMALRDDGEGTIRIALKPDSLGNVKIRLEMAENKITGHIVVESNEALNAFRREISSLEQAFKDAGFSGAELNLSLTQQGQNMDGRGQEAPSFAPGTAALRYDESFDLAETPLAGVLSEQGAGSLNMFA